MKIHVSKLEGRELDYAVAMAIGYRIANTSEYSSRIYFIVPDHGYMPLDDFFPSGDWGQCGPLIDAHGIHSEPCRNLDNPKLWFASCMQPKGSRSYAYGYGPLEAICRAIVIWHIGEEVEIPDELVNE